MKIVVHELDASGLVQSVIPEKNTLVEAVRPHLYRHNFASGSLSIQILDADDNVLATSESVNIADIGSQAFFHGYVRFYVNVGMKKDTEYKIKLIGGDGYTFSESSYIGWCNDFDFSKYPLGYTPSTDLNRPLDVEVWERRP